MFLPPRDLSPAREAERLRTLDHYDILSSLQEPVFNELVSLSARIFSLPISMLALVGADEVVYKAQYGLANLTRQECNETICALAVRQNQVVVFTDLAQLSQRHCLTTAADAAVQAKGLRFYAGVPLRMPDHYAIGTFCVVGREPRILSPQEQQVLEYLGHLIERIIVVRQACLECTWFGAEHWQLVQAYITDELRALTTRVRSLKKQANSPLPTAPVILLAVIRQLNELSAVLAEPLPAYA